MNANRHERRQDRNLRESALKRDINEEQLGTLQTLERFGWCLKFVRESPAGPMAVVRDPDRNRLAVIRLDGELDENPPATFRL